MFANRYVQGSNVSWANKISEEADSIFHGSKNVVSSNSRTNIAAERIKVTRVRDANHESMSSKTISCIEFHRSGEMLLTASYDKSFRIFQIDGKKNALIHAAKIPDLPISCAKFNHSENQVVLSGPRAYYYVYDLKSSSLVKISKVLGTHRVKSLDKFVISQDGKWLVFMVQGGYLMVVCAKTNVWLGNLKMNGSVLGAHFSADSEYLFSVGTDGEIYKWNLSTMRCVHRQQDSGSIQTTAIAATLNKSRYIATGSTSGVVNIYEDNAQVPFAMPVKSLMNLTTSISALKFNHDSQLLAIASTTSKDALKIVHLPTRTVYSNWPTANTPLHYVTCVEFSPNSGTCNSIYYCNA